MRARELWDNQRNWTEGEEEEDEEEEETRSARRKMRVNQRCINLERDVRPWGGTVCDGKKSGSRLARF